MGWISATRSARRSPIFLVREDGLLKQRLDVQVDNSGPATPGQLVAEIGGAVTTLGLPLIVHGLQHYPIAIPEVSAPTPARFTLTVGGEYHTCETLLGPVRHWQAYLVHFYHHDLGYTDLPAVCIEQHKAYFDRIVEYCRQTDDYPDEARFRWTCDTTWALKHYLSDLPPAAIRQFMDRVREGRIEITAQFAAFNSALLTHEELVRSLYYAFQLAREHRFTVTSAMTTDIPGAPWGFPQVLAKSGVRYLSTAVNQDWAQDGVPRARVPRILRPFYWAAPDGSEVLVWNTDPEYIYFEGHRLGLTESYEQAYRRLPSYLRSLEEGGYPFDAISLRTTWKGCDNVPPCPFLPRIVREWNRRWAYPRLIMATSSQFFRYMEQAFGERFPHYRGDWTDWWIDGPGSSAYETGTNRVTHEKLATAEKLAVLSSLLDRDCEYPQAAIEQAYDNLMLYDEHTWGMWNNVTDPFLPTTSEHWRVKAAFAHDAARATSELLAEGLQGLGRRIATGGTPAIAVFNPLSWPRSDVARVSVPEALAEGGEPFALVGEDGEVVPHQAVESNAGEGSPTIAFLARDVPSLGYRTFDVVRWRGAEPPPAAVHVAGNCIENAFYRVSLDPETGGIASIYDKALGVELVDGESAYRLNQLVYDSGEPPIHGRFTPQGADIYPGASGPLFGSLVAVSTCRVSKNIRVSDIPRRGGHARDIIPWLRQEVILYDGLKRIDLVNRLYKEETLEKEGLYFAFPCRVPGGTFRLEVAGASMSPGTEQLPDSCHDWHATGYWLDVANSDYGITWSSREVPVVSLGDINTGRWQTTLDLKGGSFFAYAMNNYWATNFKERQGGDVTFRFSLTSHGPEWDNAQAARFGWGYCTDLQSIALPAGQSGPLPAGRRSFCEVEQPNVMAFTCKRAEDGDGIIIRLIELAGRRTAVRLRIPGVSIAGAWRASMVEEDAERLDVAGDQIILPMGAFAIETVRVRINQ